MLTAKTRRNLESDWKSIPPAQLKIYHRRLRIQAIQALMDLALIAEREKEGQLEQIFTPTTISPLFKALMGKGCEEITARHYAIAVTMLSASFEKLFPRIYADPKMLRHGIGSSIKKDFIILMNARPPENRKIKLHDLEHPRAATERERKAILKKYLKKQYRNQ